MTSRSAKLNEAVKALSSITEPERIQLGFSADFLDQHLSDTIDIAHAMLTKLEKK